MLHHHLAQAHMCAGDCTSVLFLGQDTGQCNDCSDSDVSLQYSSDAVIDGLLCHFHAFYDSWIIVPQHLGGAGLRRIYELVNTGAVTCLFNYAKGTVAYRRLSHYYLQDMRRSSLFYLW